MRRGLAAATLLLVMTSCSPAPPIEDSETDLTMQELMLHVIQHSADGVWQWQGYEIDAAGERSLFPKTPEEWEEAESASLTLAEVSRVLSLPGRRVDEAEWDAAVEGVRLVALESAEAAERQDEEAFFAAGGRLDHACDVCHARYDPNFDPRFQR